MTDYAKRIQEFLNLGNTINLDVIINKTCENIAGAMKSLFPVGYPFNNNLLIDLKPKKLEDIEFSNNDKYLLRLEFTTIKSFGIKNSKKTDGKTGNPTIKNTPGTPTKDNVIEDPAKNNTAKNPVTDNVSGNPTIKNTAENPANTTENFLTISIINEETDDPIFKCMLDNDNEVVDNFVSPYSEDLNNLLLIINNNKSLNNWLHLVSEPLDKMLDENLSVAKSLSKWAEDIVLLSEENIQNAMDFIRNHPWEYNKYLPEDVNKLIADLKIAKDNEDFAKMKKIEECINQTGFIFVPAIYRELEEKERVEFNKGKKTLVQIFEEWVNKEISDKEAKDLYNQLKIYRVKTDKDDDYSYTAGDDNAWLDIKARYLGKMDNLRERAIAFKMAIGIIPHYKVEEDLEIYYNS